MNSKEIRDLVFRYSILLLLGISNLALFYKVFTPLTVHPVAWILKLFYGGYLLEGTTIIFFNGIYAEIIPACIAGAAYYLLLMLNLTTPMDRKQRIKSIFLLIFFFLILNIGRILIFAMLFSVGFRYFDLAHSLTWVIGSTIMVVALWFVSVWIFKIKGIPVYSDAKNIISNIKKTKK
jgi:exosortase/archaeosortase family protein